MDSELHRAVDKRYGKYSNIRVVHPMTTYREGRRAGFSIGIMLTLFGNLFHEAYFHGSDHADFWAWVLAPLFLLLFLWDGLHMKPNKISADIRKSIHVYKDE
jgi:hypothetical protein